MNNECPNCGYKMSAKDKTCKYCGTKNENHSQLLDFAEKLGGDSDSNDVEQASPKTRKTICILFGIFCLFGLWPLSILFFVLASKAEKDN